MAEINKQILEDAIIQVLKTCYDPEIPVNIVDMGLVYDCKVTALGTGNTYRIDVKMTLTAPGCGMGPMLAQEAQNKLLVIEAVDEAAVELVWDRPGTSDDERSGETSTGVAAEKFEAWPDPPQPRLVHPAGRFSHPRPEGPRTPTRVF
jgi:metal-sulfur cluster biosynthetic enzyme